MFIAACIEPIIKALNGKSNAAKLEAYTYLNTGQRSLLMFQIMYGHISKSIEEFYSLVPYLSSKKGIWQELKNGMKYFGDYNMLQLLSKMETEYNNIENSGLNKNSEILLSIKEHDTTFAQAIQETIKLISEYIRVNPAEFVHFI